MNKNWETLVFRYWYRRKIVTDNFWIYLMNLFSLRYKYLPQLQHQSLLSFYPSFLISRVYNMSSNFLFTAAMFLVVALLTFNVANAAFEEGEYCGVNGKKFMEYNFTGEYAVAGKGCTLENNTKTRCFCSIDYTDRASGSPFIWQCFDAVKFGPVGEKVCPATVPVVKPTGVNQIDFSESMLGVAAACNTSENPTGRPGDEVCSYSECESGGKYSAICGCVDLSQREELNATGMQWFCLHSTCSCGDEAPAGTISKPNSAAANAAHGRIVRIAAGLVGTFASSVALFIVGF
jgi:hypothetical protein